MIKPLKNVNLLQGTSSTRDLSQGNTLPLVARPWGMHHWTLQTGPSPWTFNCSDPKLQGIRLTHQPSPWMRDYGNVLVLPFHGPVQPKIDHQASVYELKNTTLQPNRLRVELLRYGIEVEMSPTERGAMFVFTRRSNEPIRVRFHFDGDYDIKGEEGRSVVTGVSRNHNGGVPLNFGLHFRGEFNANPCQFEKATNGGCFSFGSEVARVELRLAASFISQDQASLTMEREMAGKTLPEIISEGAAIWNDLLGRMEIEARDPEQKITFYSCLYRCLLFPRFLDELDSEGQLVHYSPYDGKVHPGPLCTDNGFWDTYRTVYPLLALVYPDKLTRILEGWLSACRESGWSPKWPSPGPRDCMIGTHFDVVVADAVARRVTDWNVEEAFRYLWKDANEESETGTHGREGLNDYIELGYVPCDKYPHAVSSTLDYSYDDFCVAQVARFLGREAEAQILLKRADAHKKIFDQKVGFMRGRTATGEWRTPFREFEWGGDYIEGGPWQHSFHVPHDPKGLAELFGGEAGLCQKLDAMLATPPRFEAGSYGYEIHEMTEMALAGFGQYAHSNQPVHGYLFLYALSGEPEKTDHWVHRIANELYSPSRLPGDEDNGEMSAWFIFACLGMYPTCPGTPDYVHFKPVAPSVTIHSPAGTDQIRTSYPKKSSETVPDPCEVSQFA